MQDDLPREVREGLEAARKRALRHGSRLRLVVGEERLPIRRLWESGVSVDAEGAPHLRGLVDIYDGGRHLYECLIVASEEAAGEMIYEFKRQTPATDRPPADFEQEADAPVALLGRR